MSHRWEVSLRLCWTSRYGQNSACSLGHNWVISLLPPELEWSSSLSRNLQRLVSCQFLAAWRLWSAVSWITSTDSSIITRAIDNMSYIQQSAMKQNGRRHNASISVIKDEHDSTTNICARSFVKLPLCCGVA